MHPICSQPARLLVPLVLLCHLSSAAAAQDAAAQERWTPLFDGHSLEGWREVGDDGSWDVQDQCLVHDGTSTQLVYSGDATQHRLLNFELKAEVKTVGGATSAIRFPVADQPAEPTAMVAKVLINNASRKTTVGGAQPRTGSLCEVQNIFPAFTGDDQWVRVQVRVVGSRVRIWVDDYPTVDYLFDGAAQPTVRPAHGVIALEGGAQGRVAFRNLAVRRLGGDADPADGPRASDAGYGIQATEVASLARRSIPFVDYHVHLRGGMTVDKAMERQAVTGINVGVLRNLGTGWPLETDAQLEEFLDSVDDRPVFVGVQVNDRNWHTKHARRLLQRLDFVLGDTMIMPMPTDDSPPVKLFQPDQFTIDDPEAWMQRYVRHNLLVLSEPITILANPTWLPKSLADQYDRLWTNRRMQQVIQAAIDNGVALEINAGSGYPHERFIRMAKRMGAKFSFGSNNFDDRPHDMSRCLQAIEKYGLTADDLYVPDR